MRLQTLSRARRLFIRFQDCCLAYTSPSTDSSIDMTLPPRRPYPSSRWPRLPSQYLPTLLMLSTELGVLWLLRNEE